MTEDEKSSTRRILEAHHRDVVQRIDEYKEKLRSAEKDLEDTERALKAISGPDLFYVVPTYEYAEVNSFHEATKRFFMENEGKFKISEIAAYLQGRGFQTTLKSGQLQSHISRSARRLAFLGKVKRERNPDPDGRTKRERENGVWRYWWVGTDLYGTDQITGSTKGGRA